MTSSFSMPQIVSIRGTMSMIGTYIPFHKENKNYGLNAQVTPSLEYGKEVEARQGSFEEGEAGVCIATAVLFKDMARGLTLGVKFDHANVT